MVVCSDTSTLLDTRGDEFTNKGMVSRVSSSELSTTQDNK